jgi:putative hemolysin
MDSTDNRPPKISIEEVIKSKNPTLLKVLPGFIIRYIKRIVHQDHVNDFISRHGEKQSYAFVDAIVEEFGIKVTFSGLENLPESGGVIVAANHPLGGLDAMALIQVLSKKRRDLKFIVNDILLSLKNLGDLFVGVNKHGKNSVETLNYIDTFYQGDGMVMIFPAGLVSRKQKGGLIRDLLWKKSFVVKAKKFDRSIVPVHIGGKNSKFFYNLAMWRAKVGIKANIEMLYLMDEMYHQSGNEINIKIGKPIPASTFSSKYTDQEWAEKIKNHLYLMNETQNTDLVFNAE